MIFVSIRSYTLWIFTNKKTNFETNFNHFFYLQVSDKSTEVELIQHRLDSYLADTLPPSLASALSIGEISKLANGDSGQVRLHIFLNYRHRLIDCGSSQLCLSVCMCVWISCEQNSSRTDAPIWTRFSLNGCLPHWLKPY